MNSMAEVVDMSLPNSAMIPAPYKERAVTVYQTGVRSVGMVWEDMRPLDILSHEAFESSIAACSAMSGSSNAPVHINAIAR